ncbi:MAG TPA: hypothetical protein VFN74_18330, partial [Chloroflexota bacterium]|nr:hypothetical protein [Chloroflexota bacterium]
MCPALLAAFAVLAAAPDESLADSKDKRKQTPRFVVRAPERAAPPPTPAPARATAVPTVAAAGQSAAPPAASEGATREAAPPSGGTITTEEARARVFEQPLPEPPAPAV